MPKIKYKNPVEITDLKQMVQQLIEQSYNIVRMI
jgi:uncharacterized protein YdhG (YjbR/CyaY superfamily)